MDFVVEEQEQIKKNHPIWVERHRPQTMDDYIGNESIKEMCKLYIKKQDIPHLLLFGPAGTGKTSLAKILTSNINCDKLYVNASDENGVDAVRIKFKNFAQGSGFKPLKIAILDEADRLTPEAQGALRNMMETYSIHTRFVLTCNNVERMASPIVSRCQTFEIKPISKPDVAKRLVSILKLEKVNFTVDDIKFIVETYYPDIRKVINFAQQSNLDGTLKICKDNAIDTDFHEKIISILKNSYNSEKSLNEIRQLITDYADPDALELTFRYLMDKIDVYSKGKDAVVILRLAEGLANSNAVIPKVRDIPFLACIYNILNDLKDE